MIKSRVAGIDLGKRKCGLSISDDRKKIAMPHCTIELKSSRTKEIIEKITTKLSGFDLDTIVIGDPVELSGKKGEMSKWAHEISHQIKETIGIKIIMWDERLSSRHAEVLMAESKIKRKKREEVSDVLSAMLILQSYLDSLSENDYHGE